MLIYNAAVWFSIIYLGQHWVVDIIAGMAWATLSYLLVVRIWPRLAATWLSRRTAPAPAPMLEPSQSHSH
jgi:membrane-associated phospholipid phosphatase